MEEEVEKVYVPELVLKRYRLSWGQVAKIIKMVRKDKNMKYFKDGARKVLGY
jgi:Mor family transcriptional regulator